MQSVASFERGWGVFYDLFRDHVTPAQVPIQIKGEAPTRSVASQRRVGKNNIQPSNGLHPHPSIYVSEPDGCGGCWCGVWE
jgi:hypothetical protein